MISIIKKSGKFHVRNLPNNGRILSHSEDFTVKLNAYKNIVSSLKLYGGKSVEVADYTSSEPTVVRVLSSGKKVLTTKAAPKVRDRKIALKKKGTKGKGTLKSW